MCEEGPCFLPCVGQCWEELEALHPHHAPVKAGLYSKVVTRGTER